MEIFKLQNVTYYYPDQLNPALKNINLSVNEGEFILLLGTSGSGKSTLGRTFNGIVPEFYGGEIYGEIKGTKEVGMVFQDPEKQLVMDNVERELAFGLENLGVPFYQMQKRIMETISFLNLGDIKNKKTFELSGGQKQKVAIGTTLAMGHRFLILDEPTSQLDPTTADELLHVIERLNKTLGYTIILIEQRIDRCFHLADRVFFMEEGSLLFNGTPKEYIMWAQQKGFKFLPLVSSYFASFKHSNIPFTIKDGRKELQKVELSNKECLDFPNSIDSMKSRGLAVHTENLSFTYNNGNQALQKIGINVNQGDVLGIMGQNGSGKSTLLKVISGLIKPNHGKISVSGKVGYLSQNPNDYLFNDSVYEELKFTLDMMGSGKKENIESVLKDMDIESFKEKNPRDLSGGERQRVALASIMVADPDILLLDEPTRGIDGYLKELMGRTLVNFQKQGKTIIVVTHDVEFVAQFCSRVYLMFDGTIVEEGRPHDVFASGLYYTTQMNKLFKGYKENILTIEDALKITVLDQRGEVG